MLSTHLGFSPAALELQGGFSLSFLYTSWILSGFVWVYFWGELSVCLCLTCGVFPLTFPWQAGGACSEDTFPHLSSLPDKWFALALILVLP